MHPVHWHPVHWHNRARSVYEAPPAKFNASLHAQTPVRSTTSTCPTQKKTWGHPCETERTHGMRATSVPASWVLPCPLLMIASCSPLTFPKYPGWNLSKRMRWWCWPPALPRPPGCFLCFPTRPWPAETCPRFLRFFE